MKRLVLMGVLALSVTVLGAAARNEMYFNSTGDLTVDSIVTGNWEQVDSMIVVFDSASNATLTITGIAVMDQWDVLYIGFGNDSANRVDSATSATTGQTNSNLDTMQIDVVDPGYYQRDLTSQSVRVPFSVTYIASFAAVTDTFYVNMATGGSATRDAVVLEDVFFKVELGAKP